MCPEIFQNHSAIQLRVKVQKVCKNCTQQLFNADLGLSMWPLEQVEACKKIATTAVSHQSIKNYKKNEKCVWCFAQAYLYNHHGSNFEPIEPAPQQKKQTFRIHKAARDRTEWGLLPRYAYQTLFVTHNLYALNVSTYYILLFLTNLYLTTHNQCIGHSNTNTVPAFAVFWFGHAVPARQDP